MYVRNFKHAHVLISDLEACSSQTFSLFFEEQSYRDIQTLPLNKSWGYLFFLNIDDSIHIDHSFFFCNYLRIQLHDTMRCHVYLLIGHAYFCQRFICFGIKEI